MELLHHSLLVTLLFELGHKLLDHLADLLNLVQQRTDVLPHSHESRRIPLPSLQPVQHET